MPVPCNSLRTSTSSELPHLQSSSCVVLHYFLVLFCMLCFRFYFPLLSLSNKPLHLQQGASYVLLVCYANTHTHSSKYIQAISSALTAAMLDFFVSCFCSSQFHLFTFSCSWDERESKSCEETVPGRARQSETDAGKRITEAV